LPLLVWFALYAAGALDDPARRPASQGQRRMRAARSPGRVVDSYTNIHSRSRCSPITTARSTYAKEAIENARRTFQREMRIFTIMDVRWCSERFADRGVVGWAIWLWVQGRASVGVVAAARR
jgi:ATP-binding cassette, subfamily B, multidrug efflux pump